MDPQTPVPQQASAPPVESAEPVSDADNLKNQIVSALNNSKNVLVTVGANPSVDALAAALGLTVLLGKLGKHATAVFSGKVPPAMEFLDPEKTFEDTVDSLRDFIIALDKEKADKLRYKVEDDVVKIFITPYRTVISEKDLKFSQGDFNVDVVVALGVQSSEEVDKAIATHGRILHDATVVAITAGPVKSNLGTIDWNDPETSSISEMLVSLTSQFGQDLLDAQTSTAFLTGIVAETNRFSNEKTTPKVMTLAAQLMAAGANQQLIATNLRQEGMISEPVRSKSDDQPNDDGGEMVLDHTDPDAKKESDDAAKKTENAKPIKDATTDKTTSVDKSQAEDKSQPEGKPEQPEAKAESEAAEKKTEEPAPAKENVESTESAVSADAEASKSDPAPVVPMPPQIPPEPAPVASELPKAPEPSVLPAPTPEPPKPPELPSAPEPVSALPLPTPAPAKPAPAPVVEPPTLPPISSSNSRDAMTAPQFGGTLNATQLEEDAAPDQPVPSENGVTLEHQNGGVVGSEEAIEAARKAVEDAAVDPPHKRLESIGSQSLEDVSEVPLNDVPLPAPQPSLGAPSLDTSLPSLSVPQDGLAPTEPDPMQSFMAPHSDVPLPTGAFTPPVAETPSLTGLDSAPSATPALNMPPQPGDLPPLPPLPGQAGATMPPLPPLPGQPPLDPAANMQAQTAPEFMQTMQSQNPLTQAGADLADERAQASVEREAKINERLDKFDQAVDRNRELNGQPPLNDPNGSGLPPLPPLPPS